MLYNPPVFIHRIFVGIQVYKFLREIEEPRYEIIGVSFLKAI